MESVVEPYVARVVGTRRGVHRLLTDPDLGGGCHTNRPTAAVEYLTAKQFAAIATETPRRLCGHCYRARDRR